MPSGANPPMNTSFDNAASYSSLTISAKPVGVGAASQPWIPARVRSSLLTRIAVTESGSLCGRMKKLTAFLELESAIRSRGELSCPADEILSKLAKRI
jgi:hypothetical protein